MGNLRKIRIGTDIITMLSVNISGNPVTWSDKDIRHVFAFSDVQGQPVAEMAFRSEGKSLRCTYAAKDQNYIGAFRIIIEFADGTSFASSLDVPAFEIVRTTEEADAEVGEVVLDIDGTMRFYSLSEAISKIEAATAAANQAASTANTAASNADEKAGLAQQAADNANKAKEDTDKTNEDAQKAELERSKAEAERLSAETARKNAENERQASETTREQNEEARALAENERLTDERARAQRELERQGNETRRKEAENARVKAESSRAESEKTRELSEASRKDAETKRASAESGRVTAEKQRVTEFSRLKSESETATNNAIKAATTMRALYKAEGAKYNEATGYYELNGLTDITEEQMALIYNDSIRFSKNSPYIAGCYAKSNARTLFRPTIAAIATQITSNCFEVFYESKLEYIALSSSVSGRLCSSLVYTFALSRNLRKIDFPLVVTDTTFNNTFLGCKLLEHVLISNFSGGKLSFIDSPRLNYTSLRWLVDKAKNTTTETVTVHATTYGYLTGMTSPSEQVGGTTEQWTQLMADAAARNISFATA